MSIAAAITGVCQGVWIDGAPLGLPTGGTLNIGGGVVHRRGVGGYSSTRGAMFTPGGNIPFIPTGVSTFLATPGVVVRAASGYPCSALTTFTLTYDAENCYQFNECKVNTMEFSCAVEEPLSATMDFQSTGVEAGTPGMGDPGDGWEWYDATCTFEGGSYSLEGFTINLDNGVSAKSDLDSPNAVLALAPKRIMEGDEMVRLTLRTKNEISVATLGAWNAEPTTTLTFNAALTNASAGTITFVVEGTISSGIQIPLEAESNPVVYTYEFECVPNSHGLTVTVA